MSRFDRERQTMVEQQLEKRGIHDPRVLDAMRTVPREVFVPEAYQEFSYRDGPLPIEAAQTISQPYIVALMAQALELKPDDRVLEVGAGSGYAASVLSRIAAAVYAIEYHEELARLARGRVERLGYDNLEIMHGDGTRGWPAHAPFDAILVSAGGPDVPPSLLAQLAIGGRMVIPVGDRTHSQELLRVRRVAEHEFEQDSLGQVQFVPLVGSEGWRAGGAPPPERPPHPSFSIRRRHLAHRIGEASEPFDAIEQADLSGLLERIGEARVVLIGEASHGSSEFYRMRARITRALIEERGFNIVALEADWPDSSMLDRYVRGWTGPAMPEPPFSRFPVWMWRNRETLDFVDWLAEHNRALTDPQPAVSIHGLDLYSLYHSIHGVLNYLDRVDPGAAARARERYACFSPWERDPAVYGRAAVAGEREDCEDEVVQTLTELLAQRLAYRCDDGEAMFDSERNARVVRAAERYYRVMYYGSRESWNLRDRHMFETLESVLEHRGPASKAVVWAHNSHIGDAAATEMGMRGEINIGQLAREAWGDASYRIGFGTDHGTVAAATNWDGPMEVKRVRPSLAESYEHLFHQAGPSNLILPIRHAESELLHDGLRTPRLQRAIGVIYRPETERISHYFRTVLTRQFDEYIWFDETRAVTPLDETDRAALPPDHPLKAAPEAG
ncbi:protein-L-isoaspartate(D-aspartate) O-methyltransferase [Wenzhouxiangella marina]|uniref:Protein-L-isoaspartate O-methyltransferase n=1 Tax=Wenzhouxiangella marina TaxID=1579979 RepID=A0A0K0XZI1_9GAMM|nr:protein-L-isoaspartate(D-aspartate) O-methyltransferase [Wenzhouxiangella marina]AKS43031.1 protein-L-isoaspartate O-methyltransferase [Wenzhouxiangella marina]MBB6087286.1 protein-L-isoaspartate(D-aspartate) O-methyltransferase [Wenzhouxiangella marina]